MAPLSDNQIAWATEMFARLEVTPAMGRLLNERIVKRLAAFIRRQYRVKHYAALNIVAQRCGFSTWEEAQPVFVSNNVGAARLDNLARREKLTERALRRKNRWAGLGDLCERITRARRSLANRSAAILVVGRGKRKRVKLAFDASGVMTPGWTGNGSSLRRLSPGDQPVDRVAVRILFNRDPKTN